MSNRTLPAGIDVVCLSGECGDLMIGSVCVETESDPLWWKDKVGRKVGNAQGGISEPESGSERTDPLPLPGSR